MFSRIINTIIIGTMLICLLIWAAPLFLWAVMNSSDTILVMIFGGGTLIPIGILAYYINDYLISWRKRRDDD